jgi:Tol biopolymer transport system component
MSPSKRHPRLLPSAMAALVAGAGLVAPPAQARIVERASIPADLLALGRQANHDSDPQRIGLSDDGRFLVFDSPANNLVAGDRNPHPDVYLLDRTSGALQLIPPSPAAVADWGPSVGPLISGDGSVVLFHSERGDLSHDALRWQRAYAYLRELDAIEPVSVSSDGMLADRPVRIGGVSRDGRFVVFDSRAGNLVDGDSNGNFDVFLRDRQLGLTTRLSVDADGLQSSGQAMGSHISADGRHVCFHTDADALIPGGGNGSAQVVLLEVEQGLPVSRTLVSRTPSGQPGNADSYDCRIAADSLEVGFESSASDLVAGDGNGKADIFVAEPGSLALTRVSRFTDGSEIAGHSLFVRLSADGRRVGFLAEGVPGASPEQGDSVPMLHDRDSGETVLLARSSVDGTPRLAWNIELDASGSLAAFSSPAADLVTDDRNQADDVFIADLAADTLELASQAPTPLPAGGGGRHGAISADGRYVAFASNAAAMAVANGTLRTPQQIYRFDRLTRQTVQISRADDGSAANSHCSEPRLSADGRFVAYLSTASNLVAGVDDFSQQLFLHDVDSGSTVLVSGNAEGMPANRQASQPAISGDGSRVAFASSATNLVPDTEVARSRIFAWSRADGSLLRADLPSAGGNSNGNAQRPSLSHDGRLLAFHSTSDALHPGDPNTRADVFVKDLQSGSLQLVSRTPVGGSGDAASSMAAISGDGHHVAFQSDAGDLVAGDGAGPAIFVLDLDSGEMQRAAGPVADSIAVSEPTLSHDGRHLALLMRFASTIPGQAVRDDAFVLDRQDGRLQRASRDRKYRRLDVNTESAKLSADGRWLVLDIQPGMGTETPGRPPAPMGVDVVLAETPVGARIMVDGFEP